MGVSPVIKSIGAMNSASITVKSDSSAPLFELNSPLPFFASVVLSREKKLSSAGGLIRALLCNRTRGDDEINEEIQRARHGIQKPACGSERL